MTGFQVWRNRAQLVLALLGIAIASYLTYVKLFGLDAYCAGIGNCEAVQTSPYSELFGIPVAILGMGVYLGLVVLWWVKQRDWMGWGDLATQVFFFFTLVGLLFSVYLTYLELFVILAICPWCVASAIVMLALFAASLAEVLEGGLYEELQTTEAVPTDTDD